MARNNKRGPTRNTTHEDYGLNEVDQFHADRDKILLEQTQPDRRYKRKGQKYESDDEEDEGVMNIDDDEDDSEEELEQEDLEQGDDEDDAEFFGKKVADELEGEDEEGWGTKRDFYGADNLDEDEETAKQIEEEALRQQKLHLQELNMDDYVDEEMEAEWSKEAKKHDFGVIEGSGEDKEKSQILQFQDLSELNEKARLKFINTSHPEFVPLTKELTKLKPLLDELSTKKDADEIFNVKFQALSAYLSAVTSYFALFLSQIQEDEPFSMKENSVMEYILSSKEVWRQASELEDDEDMEDDEEEQEETLLEGGEVSDEEEFDSAVETNDNTNLYSEDEEEVAEAESPSDSEESDLDIDITKPRHIIKSSIPQTQDDYAEGALHEVDASDKQTRKKTLRFYTSKIDQQAKKTGVDEKYTGDNDIPYKERLFERQQRLIEEARKRGINDKHGVALGEDDSDDEGERVKAKQINNEFGQDYYDTVKQGRDSSKEVRKEAHSAAVKAAREGKLKELKEEAGADGKRAVNYQIMKNKGLTAYRRKELRNSRVKKRMKYEKAKKVLKSTKAVYKAPTGAYDGEKTGIKKGLTRSVKF